MLLLASMTAYTMHRFAWPKWVTPALFLWVVFFHMIPGIVIVSAWSVMFQYVGLLHTYPGLILAHVTHNLPIGLFLMAAFVREVPRELEEAALSTAAARPGVLPDRTRSGPARWRPARCSRSCRRSCSCCSASATSSAA